MEVYDQKPDLAEVYHLGQAYQDAAPVADVVPDHTLVAEQGSRRVQLGLEDPDQARNLSEVGMPGEDGDQDQVGPSQVVHGEVGHVRGSAGVERLDAAGQ